MLDALIPQYGGNRFNVAGIESDLDVHIGDVRNYEVLPDLVRGKDVIFNLAGQSSHHDSMEDPFTDLEINCRAQLALLDAIQTERICSRSSDRNAA